MTRDYKYVSSKTQKPLPGWLWLIAGFALGLIVAFFVYLNGQQALKDARLHALGKALEQPSERHTEPPAESDLPEKRKFDFYTLLPELEVMVPEEDRPKHSSAPAPQVPSRGSQESRPASISQISSGYVLQAGSFQKLIEADSLKARLALLGVESSIQTVRVDQGTWHRVRLGPYRDRQQANRVKTKLKKNHIDTVLLVAK